MKTLIVNGRTPEDIVRGLQCYECSTCPYEGCRCADCDYDAAELIEKQLEIISDLTDKVKELQERNDELLLECSRASVRQKESDLKWLAIIKKIVECLPRWIKTEERPPDEDVTVLVYRDGSYGLSSWSRDYNDEVMWHYSGIGGDPEYWMELLGPTKDDGC